MAVEDYLAAADRQVASGIVQDILRRGRQEVARENRDIRRESRNETAPFMLGLVHISSELRESGDCLFDGDDLPRIP